MRDHLLDLWGACLVPEDANGVVVTPLPVVTFERFLGEWADGTLTSDARVMGENQPVGLGNPDPNTYADPLRWRSRVDDPSCLQ